MVDKRHERRRTRWRRFTARVPVGRLIKPEEVAEAVLYFCSPAAAATTGATLVIGAETP